ncbi:MerR family transcriptional regulator [Nocardioides dubius]
MAEPGAAAAGAPRARMNIGEVLAHLREDFPGISISKIRFLEAEGLIDPERTSAGYRKFRHADIERLRYILRMQRDHYLPLKVIGEHLDAIDRGLEPPAIETVGPVVPQVALADDGLPSADSFRQRSDLRVSRRELVKVVGIDEALLEQLESYGLVRADRKGQFDADDLVIARTAAELADFGLEPRHLRAFKTAADREVGLVEQVVSPLRNGRDGAAKARAEETAAQVAALAVKLHATLVKVGLND